MFEIYRYDFFNEEIRFKQMIDSEQINSEKNFGKHVIRFAMKCTTMELASAMEDFSKRLNMKDRPDIINCIKEFSSGAESQNFWASSHTGQIKNLCANLSRIITGEHERNISFYNASMFVICSLALTMRKSNSSLEFAMKSSGIGWWERVKISSAFVTD